MALVKEGTPQDPDHLSSQFYGDVIGDSGFHDQCLEKNINGYAKIFGMSHNSSSHSSSPSSTSSSNGLVYGATAVGANYQADQETHDYDSLKTFKPAYGDFMNAGGGSLLSFEQNQSSYPRINGGQDDYSIWEDNLQMESFNCNNNQRVAPILYGGKPSGLCYPTESSMQQEIVKQEACFRKRPNMEESSMQSAYKKHCIGTANAVKTAKTKSVPSKDPQSIAAKNRRERISERLKILQDLVPNGSKVDLVTMLEKAISYVKFLQLQVKVLATDEFWPVEGGKAPELSQVKEAIDAILLSSQKERNSNTK